MTIQKITPFLWFDNNAEEAVNLYVSLFRNSKILNASRYGKEGFEIHHMPEGTVMTVAFQLEGQAFTALNGGPILKFTPAVSFFVSLDDTKMIDRLWQKLADGGNVLMELAKYPFSEKYGWLQDKFGLSWQFILAKREQKIAPCLMFTGEQSGKAEQAINFYTRLFPNSKTIMISRYGKGGLDPEGTTNHAEFSLNGLEFVAMDSALDHKFNFSEANSFVVTCETQQEVDYYWEYLGEGGDEKAQQCGWLKDRFGVSWQVVPGSLFTLLQDKDPAKSQRVTKTMLQMKKLDIGILKRAYEGW